MPVPRAAQVTFADDERCRGESLVRAHATPQALACRCQGLLRAAMPERPSNLQIAPEFHWNRHPVGRWRRRSRQDGLRGLQEAPRPGRPRRFSPRTTSGGHGDGHP